MDAEGISFDDLIERARDARRSQDHELALKLFERASRMAPQVPGARLECAHQLGILGRHVEAESIYRELRNVLPGNPRIFRGLALVCNSRKLIEEAIAHYRQAVELSSDVNWIAIEFLAYLRSHRRFQDLADVCNLLEAKDPHSAVPFIERARAAGHLGRPELVRPNLKAALERAPSSTAALELLACEDKADGRNEEATRACRRILEIDPVHAGAYYIQAVILRESENFRGAEDVINLGLTHHPASSVLLMELARVLYLQKRTGEARSLLLALKNKSPADRSITQLLADVELQLGNTEAGALYTNELLALDGDNIQPLISLARHYKAIRRPEEARRLLTSSIEQVASRAPVFVELAELENSKGGYENSLKYLLVALALAPDNSEANFAYSRALMNMGKQAEAIRNLQDRRDTLSRAPSYYVYLGHFLQQAGRVAEAVECLAEGKRAFPESFGIFRLRAACLIKQGKYAEGRTALGGFPCSNADQSSSLKLLEIEILKAEANYEQADMEAERLCREPESPPSAHLEAARISIARLDAPKVHAHMRTYVEKLSSSRPSRLRHANRSQTLLDQIADDFSLDREALARCQGARNVSEEQRIDYLLDSVRDYPEHTGCALSLLIELRRQGYLDREHGDAVAPPDLIPRKIFQFWDKEELPEDIAIYCRCWRLLNPEFGYTLFNSRTALNYLENSASSDAARAFRRMRTPAGKAGILRLAVLANEGGIYCGADIRCTSPLAGLVPGHAKFFCPQEDIGALGTDILGATAHHPIIVEALSSAVESVNSGANDAPWLSVGPGLLTRSFSVAMADTAENWRDWIAGVKIFSGAEMPTFCAQDCFAAYKAAR